MSVLFAMDGPALLRLALLRLLFLAALLNLSVVFCRAPGQLALENSDWSGALHASEGLFRKPVEDSNDAIVFEDSGAPLPNAQGDKLSQRLPLSDSKPKFTAVGSRLKNDTEDVSKLTSEQMAERLVFGSRVVRGADWRWGDQDGGGEGVIISNGVFVDGWVLVRWDANGHQVNYRMGKGAFDLKLVSATPKELTVTCYHFQCANGRCARKEDVCDRHDDCKDRSDEENCNDPDKISGAQTVHLLKFGSRVVRGPDWKWGEQDGKPPGQGTVVSNGVLRDSVAVVRWDQGKHENQYRMSQSKGLYDLKLAAIRPQENVSLACLHFKCGSGDCTRNHHVCDGAKDCKDQSDEENCDTPFKLSGRQTAQLVKFGSRVVRGPDWQWGFQDGTPPGEGVVVSKGVLADGYALVQWENSTGSENSYRLTSTAQDLRLLSLKPRS
ncbi:hypothetical protein FOCC_FOCC004087, partial [Frankliniella occidentalis]